MKVIFTNTKIITPSAEFVGKEHELAAKLDIQEYQIIDVDNVPNNPVEEAKIAIAQLEAQITPRRLREAMLTQEGKNWLENIENLINIERNKL